MDESEYRTLADACLQRVARWLEGIDPDEVDYTTGDGMLTLEFPDGARFVLNRQGAARQMWLAAGARAWHYAWKGGAWVDDRDGHPLFARIAEVVGAKLGRPVPPVA